MKILVSIGNLAVIINFPKSSPSVVETISASEKLSYLLYFTYNINFAKQAWNGNKKSWTASKPISRWASKKRQKLIRKVMKQNRANYPLLVDKGQTWKMSQASQTCLCKIFGLTYAILSQFVLLCLQILGVELNREKVTLY